MTRHGSYRALLGNAISAMGASVEVYNKPRMQYRDECFVILLINAWELLLKSVLSKNKQRIYYIKQKKQPYRTLSISDALIKTAPYFPQDVDYLATAKNLELLIDYRDRAIHFYNQTGFGVLIYALAQTAIVNFRDLVSSIFQRDVSAELTLSLLPLMVAPPIDPVEFLRVGDTSAKTTKAVQEFTQKLKNLVVDLENEGKDTGRFLTQFAAHLVSTKKISSADIIVGVQAVADGENPQVVQRRVDPNVSHPYRQTDIIGRKSAPTRPGLGLKVGSKDIGAYQFQALVGYYKIKDKPQYCWYDATGAITRYSTGLVEFIKRLSEEDLVEALKKYKARARTQNT